ncbi:MAG TPA: acyltransferase, partial [Dermatophilaceae bacterium]|nr:acyltransferase [Dermatophilaceae bacterium]
VWTYGVVREVTLAPVTEITFLLLVGPFAFFMIALLFLVAGLLTPGSLERKGVRPFVRDRLIRLGVPFAVFVGVVQPALTYALYRPLGHDEGSYWEELVSSEGQIDTGPLWFVGVLLIYSLAYAGYVALRGRRPDPSRPIRMRHLAVLAVLVAPPTFLIRLVYPAGSEAGFSDLNLWEWPECIALFALGIAASRQGWIRDVPQALYRRSRTITLAGVVAFAGLALTAGAFDRVDDLRGGWSWLALAFAAVESALSVFGPVWALGLAQHRLGRPLWQDARLSSTAYAAFMVQGLVLIGLAVALRPTPLPAEVKALLVAGLGVVGSFTLGWVLIRWVPGLRRVL